MPALAPAPNVCQLTVMGSLTSGDTNVVNRMFYKYSGTPNSMTAGDCSAVAAAWAEEWDSGGAKAITSDQYTLVEVVVEDLSASDGAVGNHVSEIAGTDTDPAVAGGVAFVIKMPISRRYRGGHPKLYVAGAPYSKLDSPDVWNSTWASNLANAWHACKIAAEDAFPGALLPAVQVNLSRYLGGTWTLYPSGKYRRVPTPRVGGPSTDTIVSYVPNLRPASQRRRNLQGS